VTTVGFLHTSDAHIPTFRGLLSEIAPSALEVHVVDEDLLSDARSHGVDGSIEGRLRERLLELAEQAPGVILCTCSTLGEAAESLAQQVGVPVLRIDRPMAECAVAYSGRVAVVATVKSTLEPTLKLFEECALRAGSGAIVVDAPCLDAWELFEVGDLAGYFDRVGHHVRDLAGDVNVVALAQASMAPVCELLADLTIPVLCSPRLAVLRAAELVEP
jgi:Asp/Glu/Hydantoin racemase